MRLKSTENTNVLLTIPELRDLIKSSFKMGDELHIVKDKRKFQKRVVIFQACYNNFFTVESEVNRFYSETISVTYSDLLVGNMKISEIDIKRPIEKIDNNEKEVLD